MKTYTYGNLSLIEKKRLLVAIENDLKEGNFEFPDYVGSKVQLVQAQWDDLSEVFYLGFKTNLYPGGITLGFKYSRELPLDTVENFITKEIEIPKKFLKNKTFSVVENG